MLLILLMISCLNGSSDPSSCNMSSMKAFDVSNEGVRAACHALLEKPEHANQQKGLAIMYAVGINIKMADARGACMATPEKLAPQEYKKAFLENVWDQQ